jgi:hypothetical protein
MTIKSLGVIAAVTAALMTTAFAQEQSGDAPATQKPAHTRHLNNAYNQAPYATQRGSEGFLNDSYGYDRSRPGDRDPDLNPPGN